MNGRKAKWDLPNDMPPDGMPLNNISMARQEGFDAYMDSEALYPRPGADGGVGVGARPDGAGARRARTGAQSGVGGSAARRRGGEAGGCDGGAAQYGGSAPAHGNLPAPGSGSLPAPGKPYAKGSVGARGGKGSGAGRVGRAGNGGKGAAILKAMLAAFVITFTLIAASWLPLFSISLIEVTGNSYYSAEQIISNSGIYTGQNGFSAIVGDNIAKALTLRASAAERGIAESCPYVKSVTVKYELPNRIAISVEERNKSVVAPYFDSGLLIDEEGYVVDIVKNAGDSGLPVVKGFSFDRYELGKKLAVENEAAEDIVLAVINALRQADREGGNMLAWEVKSIDVTDMKNVRLFLKSGLIANLGDGDDIYYRVSTLKEIVFNGLEPGAGGLVDFSNGARPIYAPNAQSEQPAQIQPESQPESQPEPPTETREGAQAP
jgi:cell division septal protein FtsQ